uniref:Histidine phosphatase superfamily branch 1 n=1 Tax=Marseillevirus LCMAC201 TaxID=2506605 RepID=A0A481YW56_9VIRU|nr:MAG: histidine phosphatase superfamily branch 1 [Marseillevirus LCMAC201]
MKIYLLRHQERESGHKFSIPLSTNGQKLAQTKTLHTLRRLGITQVYSSPFYRVLQTLDPFVKSVQKPIKIEYALYEYLNPNLFSKETPVWGPAEEWYHKFLIDPSYQSVVSPHELKMGLEEFTNVQDRLRKFLNYLYQKYGSSQETILIASHQFILEQILEMTGHPAQNISYQTGQVIQLI